MYMKLKTEVTELNRAVSRMGAIEGGALLAVTTKLDSSPHSTPNELTTSAFVQTKPIPSRKTLSLPVVSTSTLSEVNQRGPERPNRSASAKLRMPPHDAFAKIRLLAALLSAAITVLLVSPALTQQQAAPPVGASSLQETYQDWRLSCTDRDNANECVVLQDQSQQNGQRLLAVEMSMRSDGAVATLLLPFGILLDPGVTPQIDDQPPLPALRFRTCLPTGCIVVFPVDAETLKKLRAGSVLKLSVTTAAETALTFPVSLNGLTAAIDRLTALNTN
jgi:invasion protein IalB